jgi:hypothetical protein
MKLPAIDRAGCDIPHTAHEFAYEEKRGVDAKRILAGFEERTRFASVRNKAER